MTDWTNPADIGRTGSSLDLWNTFLRDNMTHIKAPPTDLYDEPYAIGAAYSTSSTSFVDIHANFTLSLETFGGDVLLTFYGLSSNNVWFDFAIDDARQGGSDGIIANAAGSTPFSMFWIKQDLVAGTHTFKVKWKTDGGGASLAAGVPPHFAVREFS